MTDYIKREDAIKAVKHLSRNYTGKGKREDHPHIDFIIDEIKYEVPSADVAPVRHGRWEHERLPSTNGGTYAVVRCSVCEYQQPMNETNYCPGCGAKMDEEYEDAAEVQDGE